MRIQIIGMLLLGMVVLPSFAAGLQHEVRIGAEPSAQTQDSQPAGYVFDITVHNIEQLDAILNRADQLRGQFSPNDFGRIELILHGMELNLFRKKNYQKYMSIVEKARALDAQKLVDIKACQSVMQSLMIDESELPGFIEQIPYAPAEIERLELERHFTRL